MNSLQYHPSTSIFSKRLIGVCVIFFFIYFPTDKVRGQESERQQQELQTLSPQRVLPQVRLISTFQLAEQRISSQPRTIFKQLQEELQKFEQQEQGLKSDSSRVKQQIDQKQFLLKQTTDPQIRLRLENEITRLNSQVLEIDQKLKELSQQRRDLIAIEQLKMQTQSTQQSFSDYPDNDREGLPNLGQTGQGNGSGQNNSHSIPSSCPIITAARGSTLSEEVVVLRQFRDQHLLPYPVGRKFVNFYYKHSKPLATYISEYKLVAFITRIILWPLVTLLKYPFAIILCLLLMLFFGIKYRRKTNL